MQNFNQIKRFLSGNSLNSSKGFTLIEVMIVVAIIAILSAIAIPNYSNYVIRSKITEATSELATKRVRMEQYYQDNRQYSQDATACADSATVNFSFTCAATATTYTLTATGLNNMAGFTYNLDQANVKSSEITAPSAWVGNKGTCWITKPGGVC